MTSRRSTSFRPSRHLGIALLALLLAAGAAGAQTPALGPEEQQTVDKLQADKPATRREAAERLGELKSRAAAGELARVAASDPDPSVRRAAVAALGRVRDAERIPDMTAALKDPDPKVRTGAVEGLVNLYLDRDEGFFTRVRSTVVRVVPFWDERQTAAIEPYEVVDPSVTRALAETARTDQDHGVRVAAVRALGALRAGSELGALADAMAADAKLRPEVLDAFVLIGDPDAVAYVIPFFESPDASVAAQAMVAAGRLGSQQAVVPLLTAYGAEQDAGVLGEIKRRVTLSPERRKAALQGLSLIGDARAVDVFYKNLNDKDADVRRAAYEGLARDGDPRYYDLAARNRLVEKNDSVRLAQLFAIYKMSHPEVFPRIVEALRDRSLREQAAGYLAEAETPAHLLPYLRTSDRGAQRAVINALGQIGDASTADELRSFLTGTPPEIADAADRAIRRIEWRAGRTPAAERPRRVDSEP